MPVIIDCWGLQNLALSQVEVRAWPGRGKGKSRPSYFGVEAHVGKAARTAKCLSWVMTCGCLLTLKHNRPGDVIPGVPLPPKVSAAVGQIFTP